MLRWGTTVLERYTPTTCWSPRFTELAVFRNAMATTWRLFTGLLPPAIVGWVNSYPSLATGASLPPKLPIVGSRETTASSRSSETTEDQINEHVRSDEIIAIHCMFWYGNFTISTVHTSEARYKRLIRFMLTCNRVLWKRASNSDDWAKIARFLVATRSVPEAGVASVDAASVRRGGEHTLDRRAATKALTKSAESPFASSVRPNPQRCQRRGSWILRTIRIRRCGWR